VEIRRKHAAIKWFQLTFKVELGKAPLGSLNVMILWRTVLADEKRDTFNFKVSDVW
jgi:hypothetical protein